MKALLILLLSFSTMTFAQEDKRGGGDDLFIPFSVVPVCPIGQADKYEMVCDQGTRRPADVAFNLRAPATALCRVRLVGCGEIRGYVPRVKFDGLEVRDAVTGDELVSVTFGLERLLGER